MLDRRKSGSTRILRKSAVFVLIPVTEYSSSARRRRAMVSSRLLPTRLISQEADRNPPERSSRSRRLRRGEFRGRWARDAKEFFLATGRNYFLDLPRTNELPWRGRVE